MFRAISRMSSSSQGLCPSPSPCARCQLFYQLEEDARRLDYIVGGCERIFSSPLPPTMARHIVRCLQLWLLGFPFVLAGTMAPLSVALWVLATSYALVGIDEVGPGGAAI